MFDKMPLNRQLMLSFGMILAILAIVSMVSYKGLNQGFTNFKDYRSSARDTNFAGRLQASMLQVRLNVAKYLENDSESTLANYTEQQQEMEKLLKQSQQAIKDPARAKNINESVALFSQYNEGFNEVVYLINQRHVVVNERLNPAGLAMRQSMSKLIELSNNEQDQQSLYFAGLAQQQLLLGRLFVVKYLATNQESDFERAMLELEINFIDSLNNLADTLQSPSEIRILDEGETYYVNYLDAFKHVHEIITQRNEMIENTLNRIEPVLATKIENVNLSAKASQDRLGPEAQSNSENALSIVTLLSIAGIVVGIGLSYYVTQVIKRPIGGEPTEIARIAETISKGDLTHAFTNTSKATGIYSSVANMTLGLKELIGGIARTGDGLAENAEKSSVISAQASRTIEAQKERTSEVSSAVKEMSNSLQHVVEHATNSAEAAQEAQTHAQKGKGIVDQTLSSIETLAEQFDSSMLVIQNLERNSNEIGSVIEVIQGISEQTNLLALNAAIEAARAGEQGRGFAVVADEVRGLAQRTRDSTNEIQEMINVLQRGTSEAVKTMEKSRDEAKDTVEQSLQTGSALDEIMQSIVSINDMNVQVAASVEEQSVIAEEISQNLVIIEQAAEDTSAGALESAQASQSLSVLADELQEMVGGFKIA